MPPVRSTRSTWYLPPSTSPSRIVRPCPAGSAPETEKGAVSRSPPAGTSSPLAETTVTESRFNDRKLAALRAPASEVPKNPWISSRSLLRPRAPSGRFSGRRGGEPPRGDVDREGMRTRRPAALGALECSGASLPPSLRVGLAPRRDVVAGVERRHERARVLGPPRPI